MFDVFTDDGAIIADMPPGYSGDFSNDFKKFLPPGRLSLRGHNHYPTISSILFSMGHTNLVYCLPSDGTSRELYILLILASRFCAGFHLGM